MFRKRRNAIEVKATRLSSDPAAASTPVHDSVHLPTGSLEKFITDMRGTLRLAKKNNLSLWAASVAFFCLFALCPFFILVSLGSRYLMGATDTPESWAQISHLFETLMPAVGPLISQNLVAVMQRNAVADLLTIAMLGWSAYELFTCLHAVFAKISVRGKDRNVFFSNLVALLSFITVCGASTAFLILSTTSAETLKTIFGEYLARVPLIGIRGLAVGSSLGCVIGAITLIYKLMPTQKISVTHAFRGSLLFIGFFMIGRATYQLYINVYSVMNANVYGAFMSFMIVTIWIYYLSMIFLFSAQYAIYLEEKSKPL